LQLVLADCLRVATRTHRRSAVAGSSALLSVDFDKTVASGARWSYCTMEDPPEATVVEALTGRGYDEDAARRMVALVGTRLRLLEAPLSKGAASVDAASFSTDSRTMAQDHFSDILDSIDLTPGDKQKLVDILERLEAAEAAGDVSSAPSMYDMPATLRAHQATKVLYVCLDRSLRFQSRLHRNAWQSIRSSYVFAPPLK